MSQAEVTVKISFRQWAPLLAWAAILVASELGSIVAHLAGARVPFVWAAWARAAILMLVALAIPGKGQSRHLRGFVLALAAMVAGDWMMSQVQANVDWFSPVTRAQRMFMGVFLTLIPAALMALTLVRSGISRRDLYLTKGDLAAPATLPILRGVRWTVIVPLLLILVSGGLITQLWIVSDASRHLRPSVLLVGLPAAAVFAVVNASCEEFRFRCVLLARGTRCIGASHAVASTSMLFGLAHFFGHPAGFTGVVMAAFFAWILARSMLDTRGWGWAWLLHFVQDVIIFLMVLMTGV